MSRFYIQGFMIYVEYKKVLSPVT
uniref:Uncharacterized protein n=1 Tax=Anguilla anguilla TaxID=7936 RepID=A0A0E9W3K8_ANGAN